MVIGKSWENGSCSEKCIGVELEMGNVVRGDRLWWDLIGVKYLLGIILRVTKGIFGVYMKGMIVGIEIGQLEYILVLYLWLSLSYHLMYAEYMNILLDS